MVNQSSLVYEFKFERDVNVSAGKSPSVNIFRAVKPDLSYIEGRTDSDKELRDLQMEIRDQMRPLQDKREELDKEILTLVLPESKPANVIQPKNER